MAIFVEVIIRGLMLGSVYALVGMGLTLVWGVVGIVNIAHGEFVMLGAYLAFWAFFAVSHSRNPIQMVLRESRDPPCRLRAFIIRCTMPISHPTT